MSVRFVRGTDALNNGVQIQVFAFDWVCNKRNEHVLGGMKAGCTPTDKVDLSPSIITLVESKGSAPARISETVTYLELISGPFSFNWWKQG